tara:strand:- start:695 stop:1153 length:459 start_codon:yes stop_codon:yes gene_type:complete
MWNNIITQMLSFALVLCTPAYAQDAEEEPMFTSLEQGETAPFTGTLFNPSATAQLITSHQYSLTECDLLVEYEVAKARSEMQLQLSVLQIGYDSLSEKHTLLMDIKNDEINTYREMSLTQPNKNNHWWLAGGAVAGIGLSLGVFYAAADIVQ